MFGVSVALERCKEGKGVLREFKGNLRNYQEFFNLYVRAFQDVQASSGDFSGFKVFSSFQGTSQGFSGGF